MYDEYFQISTLENTLRKQDKLYETTKTDIERLRRKDDDNMDRINELEDLFLAKDKEYDKLQGEVRKILLI